MQTISYYPLSIKRKGRIAYLAFYFIAGIGILLFPHLINKSFSSPVLFIYYLWGVLLIVFSLLLSLPVFYKNIFITINDKGIFQKESFFKKTNFLLWKNMTSIEIDKDFIYLFSEKKNIKIRVKDINNINKEKILNAIRENANEFMK